MTSSYSRAAYSPYSKASNAHNQELPLRSKAFSHLDNIGQNYVQQQSGSTANQDKIAEIKKKYDKILSKSNNKSNQENSNGPSTQNDFGKSVSTFDNYDENSRWSIHNKSYQTPTTNKDRKAIELLDVPEAKNMVTRPYALRQYVNPSKTQVKSQLESNRVTLNAMKSQLQSKLKDLTTKTNVNSSLRNPSNPAKQGEVREDNSTSYEAILNKYSRNIAQNRVKANNDLPDKTYSQYRLEQSEMNALEKRQSLQTKIKQTSISNYIPKYTSSNKPNPSVIEKSAKVKQLSIISEISNSNHSQGPKDSYDYQDKAAKNKIYEKVKQIEDKYKNAQSNLIIERPSQSKYGDKGWFKNTTSYLDTVEKKEITMHEPKNEFTLHKLENSQGLSIKRTITQENFMNLNKINLIQARFQQKQKPSINVNRVSQTAKYEPSKYEPMKLETKKYQANKYESRYEQTKIQSSKNQPTKIQVKQTSNNRVNQTSTTKYSQKSVDEEKSQIQKLKEKYNIGSTTKYTNPYREKKQEKSVNIEKSEKSQPRNNQVLSKQIEKLDLKIKQIQQNKKDLNINFRPYEVSKSVPKPTTADSHKTSTSIYERDLPTPVPNGSISNVSNTSNLTTTTNPMTPTPMSSNTTSNADKNKYNLRYQAYLERVKPMYSEITLPQSSKIQSSGFAFKLYPVENNNDEELITERSVSDVNSKSRVNEYMNKVQIQNRTDTGIQERKKRLQQKVEINNTIKSLVKVFGQQAVYDEVFRNNKIWFASQNQDKKWNDLRSQLMAIGVNLSESQLKQIFALEESENNPFFSVSDNKCNPKSLAQSYKQAQTNWQQKLAHKFNKKDLEKQGFTSTKIDYDRKGHIQVEDLVRFLNIESGTFLRNRDVSIIYKRMCNNGQKLQFEQLLNIISG